ncbi:MAG: hypothetical protein LBT78_03825 [Tannerella sp.]|jgi:hypothetical protein|nr:hypothetical protein [Tannerella sp.]
MRQRFYMDTEEKRKDFDTVKTFRTIKENISKDIWGLSYEDLMKYLGESTCND